MVALRSRDFGGRGECEVSSNVIFCLKFPPNSGYRIASYINNLHPRKHGELYAVLEQIISQVIPLWNMTLTPAAYGDFRFKRVTYDSVEYDPHPDNLPEEERLQQGEDEDENDFWEREEEWLEEYRKNHLVLPEPEEFEPPEQDMLSNLFPEATEEATGVNLRNQYSDKNLQIIVKLANIRLTPEKPYYEGGTWHVEGQLVCECQILNDWQLRFANGVSIE